MAKIDPEIRAHREWLGLLQPVGLVVSPPALVKGQAVPSQNVAELQQHFISVVDDAPTSAQGADAEPAIGDLPAFFRAVLGWSLEDIAGAPGGPDIAEGLELVLPDYGETLRPTYAVIDSMGDGATLMLVQSIARGASLDETLEQDGRTGWSASPQAKLERLLREVKVPTGLLCNGDALRLVYAPSGESSGHLTFPVAAMCEVSGRGMLAALHMLLSEHRVFSAPAGRRLADLLVESRKYQAEVSNALSDQVLGALWELLRGFQASDPEDGLRNFDQTAREDPQHIYGGLLTLLMRLIFVLYAEDEGLMPAGEVYANNYSVSGLFNRLRSDAGRYPDTMDQRYGAYAWLLSLFRLVFDGGGHGGMRLPTRHGQLFNPDEYPFLEGRPLGIGRVVGDTFDAPRVSDGCIYRVLDALLVLDGERLSYRALDVEQVGSVYEAMMGYEVERAEGRSIALRPKHVVVDVDGLLAIGGAKRGKRLKDQADADLSGASATALKDATTAEEIVAALGRKISPRSEDVAGTPRLMPPGSLYLQPGEERRRTGSHYTPRELTQPIVQTTLRPVLEALGDRPTPEQILDLKVCDPAMGSGAFLVEACRQLAEKLETAWQNHDAMPKIPADEEPILHARRLVAQRCLYGVDKNPFAVNLAKLSLWLVTLAKDHAFTFIDHSLKHGDSLVGLTKKQIAAFDWKTDGDVQGDWIAAKMAADIETALGWRDTLQATEEGDYSQMTEAWWEAENALADARLIGDLVVAAFFGAEKDKAREELRNQYRSKAEAWRASEANRRDLDAVVEELRGGKRPVPPLHWEIEFPEVFARTNPGFDALVGNPPFLGGKRISATFGPAFKHYLAQLHDGATGNTDLVGHFFRRGFSLLRIAGTLGLVATNTIAQGDTRRGGLTDICRAGGTIYFALRRLQWPGQAAVVVSVLGIRKGASFEPRLLDGVVVPMITAFLFHAGGSEDPAKLKSNEHTAFLGTYVLGDGFLFEDGNPSANSMERYKRLISAPENAPFILPYMGGEELSVSPRHSYHRYAIDFGSLPLAHAQSFAPELVQILEDKVRPFRSDKPGSYSKQWWMFARRNLEGRRATEASARVLAIAQTGNAQAFAFVEPRVILAHTAVMFAPDSWGFFCAVQTRPHLLWARFFSATMKDDCRYIPSDCFDTFPLPPNWPTAANLEAAGRDYYEFRADLMVRNDEGLTKTYNRFHDPNNRDPDIAKLRELHAAMDRAVLDAYGWTDIPTDCEFLLDYEIDEETWGNKKKPYRYRWPDEVHDEVLARLLDLNQKRHAEEVAAGLHGKGGKAKSAPAKEKSKAKKPKAASKNLALFEDDQ